MKRFKRYISQTQIFAKHLARWMKAKNQDITIANPNYDPIRHPNPTAIYFVHGMLDRELALIEVATQLQQHLPAAISTLHLLNFKPRSLLRLMTSFKKTLIEAYAKILQQKVDANGDKTIILIGHSRGGLVSATYAEELAKHSGVNVKTVIGIGSPFKGSPLARSPITYLSPSVVQMSLNSAFLQALATKMQSSSVQYYFIRAENDLIVPHQYAYLENLGKNFLIPEVGHISILANEQLIAILVDCIQHSI